MSCAPKDAPSRAGVRYRVVIQARAGRDLRSLPPFIRERVTANLLRLGEDPRPPGALKLVGRDGWRIRVGDYRVLYDIDDRERVVTIAQVGHRRNIYLILETPE